MSKFEARAARNRSMGVAVTHGKTWARNNFRNTHRTSKDEEKIEAAEQKALAAGVPQEELDDIVIAQDDG